MPLLSASYKMLSDIILVRLIALVDENTGTVN